MKKEPWKQGSFFMKLFISLWLTNYFVCIQTGIKIYKNIFLLMIRNFIYEDSMECIFLSF
ncbi:hypothetical protein BEI60_08575 [Eisenbergiella tayi]|nr:hypothetical protein BEI60_08575 [Eisenbergiella tayi]